jgi:hypothetical protein
MDAEVERIIGEFGQCILSGSATIQAVILAMADCLDPMEGSFSPSRFQFRASRVSNG